jgi:hypothetical protein
MIATALLLGALLVSAPPPDWQPTGGGKKTAVTYGIQATLPPDWLYDKQYRGITASHDGPLLELVTVMLVSHKDAFAAAKRPSTADLSPEDLADAYLANLQAGDAALESVTVLETEPAELAGRPAFRVHLRYRAPARQGGAQMEEVTVGTALPSGLLLATYRAPAIHFFAQWRTAFDDIVSSVRRN